MNAEANGANGQRPLLNCNQCSAPLQSKFVVANCSHVFCKPCVTKEGLKRCPICGIRFEKGSLRVISPAKVSNEELVSVLVGFPPQRILEAASVAVDFWVRQQNLQLSRHDDLLKQNERAFNEVRGEYEKQIVAVTNEKNCIEGELVQARRERDTELKRSKDIEDKYLEKKRCLSLSLISSYPPPTRLTRRHKGTTTRCATRGSG